MRVSEAIRSRRVVRSYHPEPVPREQLERILEAARWAPNHRQTEPWRFRVLGPPAYARLLQAAGSTEPDVREGEPTLVVASYVPSVTSEHAWEDEQAAACAVYAVLLQAREEGLASFWRTSGLVRSDAGREALGIPEDERVIGMLHFGEADDEPAGLPERRPVEQYVTFLD